MEAAVAFTDYDHSLAVPQPVESSGGAAARILAGGSFVNFGHPLCKFRGDRFDLLLLLLIYLSTVPSIGENLRKPLAMVSCSAFYTLYTRTLNRGFATMRISLYFFFFFIIFLISLFLFFFFNSFRIACLAFGLFWKMKKKRCALTERIDLAVTFTREGNFFRFGRLKIKGTVRRHLCTYHAFNLSNPL